MTTTNHKKKIEAVIPQEMVNRLIENAGENVVLVGGQALAFWANRYGVKPPKNIAYFSRDIDFLAGSAAHAFEVIRFAEILDGYAIFPSKHALTALIGQAVKELSDDAYFNVDILHKVLSGTEGVRKRATRVEFKGHGFKVMHQLDVLASRLMNLYKLPEKQTPLGVLQLKIAVEVMRVYLREEFARGSDMRPLMHFIVSLVKSDAGKKVADRWSVHIADAIDPVACSASDSFFEHQMPSIVAAMSCKYRAGFVGAIHSSTKP